MKKEAQIPVHILDDAAKLPAEEFNAKKYTIEVKNRDTGRKEKLRFFIYEEELRLYWMKEDQ